MLTGSIKVKDLVKKAAALSMKAVAMTDHGNMFGAISFYKAAKDAGIGAILGTELLVEDGGRVRHLPVLAESVKGYQNIVWLTSQAHVRSQEGQPRIAMSDLEGRTEGVIGLTGCMAGIVPQRILEEGEAAGAASLEKLGAMFAKGSLYVELQDHGLPEQPILNDTAPW
jgi:DNA polymerase III subunit alpha